MVSGDPFSTPSSGHDGSTGSRVQEDELMGGQVQDTLLSMIRCCGITDRDVTYVSVPITTGRSYLSWRRQNPQLEESHPEYQGAHQENVVRVNLDNARDVIARVRRQVTGPVIDPTLFVGIDGWDQSDYHQFWTAIIEQFVQTVVFADGWQYSAGCAVEFLAARENGIDTRDEGLSILTPSRGFTLLTSAVQEFAAAGLDAKTLSDVATYTPLPEVRQP